MAADKSTGSKCGVCGAKVADQAIQSPRVLEPLKQQYQAADPTRRARAAVLRKNNLAREA